METPLLAAALVFAASIHCVGMCGGFVAAVAAGSGRRPWPLIAHQLLLQLGKATSYAFLGALAGALGGRLLQSPALAFGGRVLAIVAGIAILGAGLVLLGLGGSRAGALTAWVADASRKVLGPLLESRPTGFPLVVGLVMGFLPCPLVWAGLGAAAATGRASSGALLLGGVALGTVPALALVAAFGAAVPLALRRNLARVAGVILLATGLMTAARGIVGNDHSAIMGEESDCCVPGRKAH